MHACPKCGGSMEEGRIPVPLNWFMAVKATRQRHFSLDTNVEKAMACLDCGYIEFFLNPEILKAKLKNHDKQDG